MCNEATPRPWTINETPILAKKLNHYAMIASAPHHVATVINLPEAAANAELIVRAVNAHEPMLAALRAIKGWLDSTAHDDIHVYADVAAAIALATEGTRVPDNSLRKALEDLVNVCPVGDRFIDDEVRAARIALGWQVAP